MHYRPCHQPSHTDNRPQPHCLHSSTHSSTQQSSDWRPQDLCRVQGRTCLAASGETDTHAAVLHALVVGGNDPERSVLLSSRRQGTILGPTPVLSPVRNPYDALRPAAAAAAAAAAGTATAAAAGLSMPLSDRPGVTGTNTEYTLHERGPEGLGSTMAALRAALKPSTLPVGRSWLTDQPPPEPGTTHAHARAKTRASARCRC